MTRKKKHYYTSIHIWLIVVFKYASSNSQKKITIQKITSRHYQKEKEFFSQY